MTSIQFVDFDLLIEPHGDDYRALLLDSPAGQAELAFTAPFTAQELEIFFLRVSRPRRGVRRIDSDEMQLAKRYGSRLFQTIFKDEVYACFRSSLVTAQQTGKGLRIRLRLDAPSLNDLPWEYLFDTSHNRFLTTSVETPVVRYFDLPQPIRPLAITPPLNIAVMISSPSDYPGLNVTHEWEQLVNALNPLIETGVINLERIEPANLEALQRRLRRKDYHIFHFIGHGTFDSHNQDGVLLFEDEQQRGVAMSGQYMGALLRDHKPLRLVVLNACEGARTSTSDPFAGIAQGLIQQGLPAVIGMQFEITDQAAITFSQEFYSALVDGYPVDAALAEARKAIFARGNDTEWGTPVLFTRAPDGYIFQIATASRPPQQAAAPSNETPPTITIPEEVPQTAEPIKESHRAAAAILEEKYLQGLKAYVHEDWKKACYFFEQVVAERANYEDAAEKLRQAQAHLNPGAEAHAKATSDLYREGLRAMGDANWRLAKDLFLQVTARQPGYQDVTSLLLQVEKRLEASQVPPSPQPEPARATSAPPRLHGTLCVETLGGIATPLLWQGETLPASATQVFTTATDNQSEVEIHLTFGSNRTVKDNLSLSKFSLTGIPPAPHGIPQIEVTYRVDANLQLSVDAQDKARGYHQRSQTIDLSRLKPPKIVEPLPPRDASQTSAEFQSNVPNSSPVNLDDLLQTDSSFKDFFTQIFGEGKTSQRGADLQFKLELSLEEAVLGCEKTVQYTRRDVCERCKGDGAEPPSKPEVCRDCNGSGEKKLESKALPGKNPQVKVCSTCNGTGIIIRQPCIKCNKTGFQDAEHKLAVKVPAGVNNGTKIRLAGEGNSGRNRGGKGDLYFITSIKEHPIFVRQGDDLILEYPVEEAQTRKASTIQVPLIEGGQVKLTVPMFVQSGTELNLPGKGANKLKVKGRGDLRVVIQVYDPRKPNLRLSEQRKRILKELKRR